MFRDPADGFDRTVIRAREAFGRRRSTAHKYTPDPEWHQRLHEYIGLPWPCGPTAQFDDLWAEVAGEVRARGVELGRGSYGGWDDADAAFARAVWCLTTHLRPNRVVETGVARGITSRLLLERLARERVGHLWSIDLPAMDPNLHDQIGIAVPTRLHGRWTYITGTSRRKLPGLLDQIGPIDLFVHDSSHTNRNVRFELAEAWSAMRRGVIVADDVNQSPAFASFARGLPPASSIVAAADDGRAFFGIALKHVAL